MSSHTMEIFVVAVLYTLLLAFTCGRGDVIYPSSHEKQQLATRIHCQAEETQHFQYSSITKLWKTIGGEISVSADIALHCLGDDKGGRYETEALKYLAEISNLVIEEKSDRQKAPLKRRKRGVGDFLTKTWKKVKDFFNRVFGGNRGKDTGVVDPDILVDDRKEVTSGNDDEEEEFNVADLKPLYSVPFQFVQLANGSIPEIRFAENEVEDGSIRNFKRHLVDAFATQLNFDEKHKDVIETTVTGEHTSTYNITFSGGTISMNFAGYTVSSAQEEPTVTVNKLVTESHIRKLAPSEALNDKEKMQLTLNQMQIFKGGKLLSSSGTSSILLLPEGEVKRSRIKRESADDLTSNFRVHSTFDIRLRRRQRRSAKETARLELHENLTFLPTSRFAEREGNRDRQKLRHLQESAGNIAQLFENLLENQGEDYDEKMQIISEMVHREVDLKLDGEPQSISRVVRRLLSKEKLEVMCANNLTICKDFLQLLAVAGGPQAEKVFLSFLKQETTLTSLQLRMVTGILSDLSSPSSGFLNSLVQIVSQRQLEPEVLGAILLGCGSLGSKAELKVKNKISKMFIDLLNEQVNECRTHDDFLIDLLEAVGNLGCRKTAPTVLEVSRACQQNSAIQIACIHALRHHSDLSSVKQWMQTMTSESDCEVIRSVVGALLDKIQEQQMIGDTFNWPRNGFNQVDENLKQLLLKSHCSVEDTIIYFSKKRNPIANEIAENYFGPEAEPWNPGSGSRQKRALWDNLNCNEWKEDDNFRPIQDKEEFALDRSIYNKRKSCLAFRRLGIKGANAEIYAGMFAGVKEPSDPPKYKLFTKFVSGLNFLGNQMEIGSFYFYHHTGKTKAYIRILGQTRQEFTHDGCTPTDLRYRPIKHIPLYMVSVSAVQLSLGIHLSSQLAMNTECPGNGIYQMEPLTDVRIGGEALGTIAMARGAINLGGNFNYKLQFTFTPTPNMCLKGSHGYDPMSVSFESYYQLWNAAKNDWGKHRTWKPNSLSWVVKEGNLKPWFKDTCIRTDDHTPSINMERELE